MAKEPKPEAVDPAKLAPEQLAKLLSHAGGKPLAPAVIKADVAAGAPTNKDGTLHLVRYTAWLAEQIQ